MSQARMQEPACLRREASPRRQPVAPRRQGCGELSADHHLPPAIYMNAQETLLEAVKAAKQRGRSAGLSAVYLCLEAGANADAYDATGKTPLHHAVCIPDAWTACAVIRALVEEGSADVNAHCLLDYAAQNASAEAAAAVVGALLAAGADANARDGFGTTPLAHAARSSDADAAAAVAGALVAAGAHVDSRDDFGHTLLHRCASTGTRAGAAVASVLLAAGADAQAMVAGSCTTALHCAAKHGGAGSVEVLILALVAAGADVNASQHGASAPLHWARLNPDPAAAAEAARALLAAGADARACDGKGRLPLVAAMQRKGGAAEYGQLLQVLAEASVGADNSAEGPSSAEGASAGSPAGSSCSDAGAASSSGSGSDSASEEGGSAATPSQVLKQLGTAFGQLLKRRPASARTPGDCVVCLDAPAAMAFCACGHLAICEDCAPRLGSTCPVCRAVGAPIKIHM